MSHIEKNEKLGRPVSPHVTIYAFPLAAWTSVAHRFTGAALTVGMYSIGIGALAGADVASYMNALGHSGIGPLAKFIVAFPITFHTLGGVRHLYWERFPDNLSPETQRQASVALLASSTVIAAGVSLL
jgi:succinate dehydrogenase (ubiquinone) cytochrome b560 subunit